MLDIDCCDRFGATAVTDSVAPSFLGDPLPNVPLRFLSRPLNRLRLDTEDFLRCEVDLTDGLGLVTVLLIRAEAGIFGGGMLSCFGGCGGWSPAELLLLLLLLLDVFLFQLKLSFRRNDVPEEGVMGFSGLEISEAASPFNTFDPF